MEHGLLLKVQLPAREAAPNSHISNCQHWVKLLLLLPAAYPSDAVKIHTDYLLLSPDFGHDLGDLGMGARNSALTTSGVDESSSSSSRRMKSIKESKAAARVG